MHAKWISSCLAPVLIFVGLIPAVPENSLSAPNPPENGEDRIVLPLDEEKGLSMTRLLEFAGKTLDISILYEEAATNDQRYQFTSSVEVARAEFQGFFERLLLNKGFLFLQSGEGKSAIYRALRISPQTRSTDYSYLRSAALYVGQDALEAYADRGILVTVFIKVKNLDNRALLQSLNPYFMNAVFESIRTVDTGGLILTAVGQKAAYLARMVKMMDAEAPPRADTFGRIEHLEKRVKALEARLKDGDGEKGTGK